MSAIELGGISLKDIDLTPVLTAQDRCDSCQSQAYVSVDMTGTALLFCAHHFAKHEDALILSGGEVTFDSRDSLLPGSEN